MNPIPISTVAVGSTNPVKVAAVKQVIQRIWPLANVINVAVAPGVSVQPLTDEEAISGASNRARLALATTDADLGIGVEGNTVETPQGMFTTAWVVAVTRTGMSGIGGGGRLWLPSAVARAVRAGGELGPLMDELAGEANTKQRQGAVGILTAGLITREEALATAVTFALARFVSPQLYEG